MNEFLKSILDAIYGIVQNYGLSIIVFTIFIRLCLLPLDYKSRVGMRKITKLAPMQQKLQEKYGKDPDKMQRKLAELYQKEKVSPMSSCWPLLVSMPIMIAMFTAMRMMANEQVIQQAFNLILEGETALEPFLWIKNLWMPDSPFNAALPTVQTLQIIEARDWLTVFNAWLAETPEKIAQLSQAIGIELTADSFGKETLKTTIEAIGAAMTGTPGYAQQVAMLPNFSLNLIVTQLTVAINWNGLFLLPLMSAGSQFLMTSLNPQQPAPQPTGDGQQQPNTGNFMKWFFPIFSLWICAGYNAAFALYWVTGNLIAMATNFGINKYLDHKDAQADKAPAAGDQTGAGVK